MPVRLSLLALAALLLSACDGNPLQTASRQACCCDRCPTTAAPAAPPAGPAKAVAPARRTEARVHRARTPSRPVRESRAYGYERAGEGGYGGRYGARGGVYGGTRVSVQETESVTTGYSYSESSSGYAYGAVGGGYPCPTGCRDRRYAGGHPGARTDAEGYLTWPGKVED
ncbi:MAG: hypothetical protein Q7T19_13050 [Caulobacter sp.]|nr:hypothetical protein [Caulobacter sp.]